jgi:putative isomerase
MGRAWNTWSARPAEMVFLPLGVRVTPVAYSDHLRRATLFPPGAAVSLREHTLDGSRADLELEHGGTQLHWSWRKSDPFAVRGGWHTEARGEWGLRFWLTICLSSEGGESVRFAEGAALVQVGSRYVALCSNLPPVLVTGHASLEAVVADYETHGYFHLRSRATAAPVLALRFNVEMMPESGIAAAVSDDPAQAIARARAALELRGMPAPDAPTRDAPPCDASARATPPAKRAAVALDAVRDVMAWNTVYDEINGRPYTCISRNWNQAKFGGFGVWLDDQFFHALATGCFDAGIARENLQVALANATPQGNLACLVTANDAWVDRTQIPVGAFVVRLLYERLRDRSLVTEAFEALLRNHEWWWSTRDPLRRGLVAYGSSAIGDALYVGTPFGARNESSMDNSPIHDEAAFDAVTRTLTSYDVGLNSLLALDAQSLGFLARAIGRIEKAEALEARGEALRLRIQTDLWDPERAIFANRLRDGRFVRSVGPTSFYPLVCGAASEAQLAHLVRHLDDPARFGGRYPLPSVSRDDPAFGDNSYWRGRIWPPLNFLVWQGLRRNGLYHRASRLARESFALFLESWSEKRLCPENFNADTGLALDQPDTDGFYGWGVLMPMMAVGEVCDVNPWGGWELDNSGEDYTLGPLQSPAGDIRVERSAGRLTVRQGDRLLFSTDIQGRLSHLRLEDGFFSVELPASPADGARLTLPAVIGRSNVQCRVGEALIPGDADGAFLLPPGGSATRPLMIVVFR